MLLAQKHNFVKTAADQRSKVVCAFSACLFLVDISNHSGWLDGIVGYPKNVNILWRKIVGIARLCVTKIWNHQILCVVNDEAIVSFQMRQVSSGIGPFQWLLKPFLLWPLTAQDARLHWQQVIPVPTWQES
jgi:hypothetical protein